MDYKRWLLDVLLTRYEKSKSFATGIFSKRILLNMEKERLLEEQIENPDEKNHFFSVLADLKSRGMIDYSWVKYEQGNLVEKIWLIPEAAAITSCYKELGRKSKKDKLSKLEEQIHSHLPEIENDGRLSCFLAEMQKELADVGRIPRFFTEDEQLNEDILKCLIYIGKNHDEVMERLLSSRLYGDSKYFERNVKGKIVSILKYWKKREEEDIPEEEELLGEQGIVRWPEIMEFTGNVKTLMKDGSEIDFCTQKYGAYINSNTIKQMNEVILKGVQQIIFIENKANYIWYLSHEKKEDELVVFHGGCYSPIKGVWFQKIYENSRRQMEKVDYFHWSDIDVGGFRIFCRLKEKIIPQLQPYKMDVATLMDFKESALKIETPSYKTRLKNMRNDSTYIEFWEVIDTMLEFGIRLEQEKIIV